VEAAPTDDSGEQMDGDTRALEADGGFDEACVLRMFEEFDTDGDGLLDLAGFEEVLNRLGVGEVYGDDQVQVLAKTADANGDGFIDVGEFSVWLKSFASGEKSATNEQEGRNQEDDAEDQVEDLRKRLLRFQTRLRQANIRATAAETELEAAESAHALKLRRAEDSFTKSEAILEEQATASLQFWRMVAGTSSSATLGKAVEISTLKVIGSGKYSFVVKSTRISDGRCVVAKLLSLRWVHVAVNEWYISQIIGEHPNILKAELDDVWLHSDKQQEVAKAILSAYQDGTLRSKGRAQFPTHYVGLLYDFMNCGTVQQCMDEDRLSPGGLLTVMQQTACALAHLHKLGVSHNDVKPQNLLLAREDESNPNSKVTVKLADLGLGAKSSDHSKDISQFVMTVYCMATGEQFGVQKLSAIMNSQGQLRPELVEKIENSLTQLTSGSAAPHASTPKLPCAAAAAEGTGIGRRRVHMALAELPGMVRGLCDGSMSMAEVRDSPWLQGWSFSDEDAGE